MLKTLTTRTPEPPAGEPEAWRTPREAAPVERAPWRSLREPAPAPGERPVEGREAYAPAPAQAGPRRPEGAAVEGFRELARTIERRRLERAPARADTTPPVRTEGAADPATARRGEPSAAPNTSDRTGESTPAADKADVARLEGLLTAVLERLGALEEARTGRPPLTRSDEGARSEAAEIEARWAARRARAIAPRPDRPASPEIPPTRAGAPRRLWS